MVLGKLDSLMEKKKKNEGSPLSYTKPQNQLKMNLRLEHKT